MKISINGVNSNKPNRIFNLTLDSLAQYLDLDYSQ